MFVQILQQTIFKLRHITYQLRIFRHVIKNHVSDQRFETNVLNRKVYYRRLPLLKAKMMEYSNDHKAVKFMVCIFRKTLHITIFKM